MSLPSAMDRRGPAARFLAAARVFLQPRVLIVLFLGFSSGLPLALSGSTLAVRMADSGVDLGTIGLFGLVGVPYTLKFLWAPIVDALQVPVLGRLLGHRRGWLIASQILLMAAIVFLGSLDPLKVPLMVAAGALVVAIASATQDIVIDAFRVESLKTEEQAAGMAWFVAAYRIGLLAATAGAIGLVAWLEYLGVAANLVWFYGYAAMAGLVLIGTAAALFASEPQGSASASLMLASLLPCVHVGVGFACAVGSLGALQGSGEDVSRPAKATTVFAAAGVRGGTDVPITESLGVVGFVDLRTNLTRTTLRLNDREVWSTPAFGGDLGVVLRGQL